MRRLRAPETETAMGIMPDSTRREFLTLTTAAASVPRPAPLIIDTHLEVWTFDPKFPFHHPEHPELKRVTVGRADRERSGRDARIWPEVRGADQSPLLRLGQFLHQLLAPRTRDLFVAHGLLDPRSPNRRGGSAIGSRNTAFRACDSARIYHPNSTWLNSKEHYPLWREAERLGRSSISTSCRIRCRCSKTWPDGFRA